MCPKVVAVRGCRDESWPGSASEDREKQVTPLAVDGDAILNILRELKEQSSKIEQGQAHLIDAVKSITSKQEELTATVTTISTRLEAVESKLTILDSCREELSAVALTTQSLTEENAILKNRLDELEDRSRRENLVFFGIPDSPQESWQQSEEKIVEVLLNKMSLNIPTHCVARAHRIGAPDKNKTRPIIVKLTNYKTKDQIFSAKSTLKGTDITVTEDFCPATRHARKKLVEFAKETAPNESFKLRYNKLTLNKKCYKYCPVNDTICELSNSRASFRRWGDKAEHSSSAT